MVGDSDQEFGLDGSVRTTTAATYNYDSPELFGDGNRSDGLAQGILRLTAGGWPADWFNYEVHAVQMLSLYALTRPDPDTGAEDMESGGLLGFPSGAMPYRIVPLDLPFGEEGAGSDVDARLMLDRLSLKFTTSVADITVGRQAITFGKAYFWNPLDVFFAFGATQFDRDYKPGVDALVADIPIGDFSGFTLVGAMGDIDSDNLYRESAILGRAYTTLVDWDVALQGGKIRGGYQLGAAASGEIWVIETRAEAAYFWPMQDDPVDDHLMGVLGLGHRFENSLQLETEYLYNGGAPDDLLQGFALVEQGRLLHASQHITGLVASYEILPILSGSMAWLLEWDHTSVLLQPSLAYSAADEVDILAGALIALGQRPSGLQPRSEFGTYPHFFYVHIKAYF